MLIRYREVVEDLLCVLKIRFDGGEMVVGSPSAAFEETQPCPPPRTDAIW
jgi:hypothetical protein